MVRTRSTRWLVMLSLLLVWTAPVQAGRHDPMYVPEPIMVPDGRSIDDVRRAVYKVLAEEEFTGRDITAGHIQAERTRYEQYDSYTAVVDLHFDSKTIRVSYKDSKNLNFDSGKKTIHGRYNSWVRDIERKIRRELWSH